MAFHSCRFPPLCLFLALLLLEICTAWAPSSAATGHSPQRMVVGGLAAARSTPLQDVTHHWTLLDGPEWSSIERRRKSNNVPEDDDNGNADAVCLHLLSGKDAATGQRLLGVCTNNEKDVLADTSVKIPEGISDKEAARTWARAWAAVHSVLPSPVTTMGIGGSARDDSISSVFDLDSLTEDWTVVILGGNEHALTAARALLALGCTVHIVSTKKVKAADGVSVWNPSEGYEFCSVIKTFDAVLDTVGNEWMDDRYSTVLSLLTSQHDCNIYVSTVSAQQFLVAQSGVLFGPSKASGYANQLGKKMLPLVDDGEEQKQLGGTVQRLLDNGITWPESVAAASVTLRDGTTAEIPGWTLGDYWEYTTWPQTVDSMDDVRYGFPTRAVPDDDEDNDEEDMDEEDKIPLNLRRLRAEQQAYTKAKAEIVANPHVLYLTTGVGGLEAAIVDTKLDSVLFLSAPYCRTCQYLTPKYQRMARLYNERNERAKKRIQFAKADAVGILGKALGKHLDVDAVPTFVFFRNGERYGRPLPVSRLPSEKLEKAIFYLEEGNDWDDLAIMGSVDEEDASTRSKI